MALSDEEQRMLNLIAERMYQDDPKWATTLAHQPSGSSTDRRRAGLAVLTFLIGMAILVAAVPIGLLFLGPIGFLIALTGAVALYRYLPRRQRR